MATLVQIRDVSGETKRVLKARAAANGQSLNVYLRELLDREAARPTVAEVLDRAARRSEKTSVSAAEFVAAARRERDPRS